MTPKTPEQIEELREHYDNTDLSEEIAAAEEPEETEAEKARKDKFHVVPNRQARRNMVRLKGEVQPLRSRIRRRVYRVRRYYESK